jgi:chromosomal replication initiator protein
LRHRSPQTTWETALGQLELQVTRPNFDTWLRNTVGLRMEPGLLVVGVPTDFALEWLRSRMGPLISRVVSQLVDAPIAVSFEVLGAQLPAAAPAPAMNGHQPPALPTIPLELDGRLTFASFIVLPGNRIAYRAAKRLASGDRSYNPLILYGPPGLGKTHLLQAIGHEAAPGGGVIALTGEAFVDRFTRAVRAGQPDTFRELFRSCSLLLLDDLQFLATRPASQEQFFHIFDAIHRRGGAVAATIDAMPDAVAGLSDRLRSRLLAGLCAALRPLSRSERLEVLRAKVSAAGKELSEELLALVAREEYGTVRELDGALNRLAAYAELTAAPISPDALPRALQPFADNSSRSPHHVLQTVATHFNLSLQQLAGPSRARDVTFARHIAMYLLHDRLSCSLTSVGHLLGGRDHSTVLSGCRRIARELASLPETRTLVEQLAAQLDQPAA